MATSNSIPASNIVNINTNVLSPAGTAIDMNQLMLTENNYLPLGQVYSFASATDVGDYFGASSTEYDLATTYFNGYTIAQSKPGILLFSRFNTTAAAGFLRSASLGTLEELQALSGTLTIVFSGVSKTGTIDLSGDASQTDMAITIQDSFTSPGFTVAYNSQLNAFVFTSTTTGATQTITYATGTLADDLKLQAAQGAVLSQGANALASTDVAGYMNDLLDVSRNFATFMTVFEPSNAIALAFAAWNTDQDNDFAYMLWDSSAEALVQNSTDCIMALVNDASYSGVSGFYNNATLAAFAGGIAASIDFNQTNNAPTFKFKQQAGITPTCYNLTEANTLIANGYNFYGNWANSKDEFKFLAQGQITGDFNWIDEFVNQIYMKKTMQATWINLLLNVPKIPYNQKGYTMLRNAQLSNIQSFVNYGAIQSGVTLSSDQQVAVNNAAGVDITGVLFATGWYLQVKDPGATVRDERGSPICNFWYTSGGAVHYINATATLIQ